MSAVVSKIADAKPAKSKLRAVAPKAAEPTKPKILIYGKPGVGKSWTALDFPSCYYIDCEGGANLSHYTDKLEKAGGMYLGPDQGALSFDTLIEQITALATEEHQFRTLVVDSITKLYMHEIAREAVRLGDKNAFGADKKPAVAYMRHLVSLMTRLDMNVILIAHEKGVWGKDGSGQPTVIDQTFDAWDKLEYELHLCLQIIKAGSSRKAKVRKTRLVGFPDADTFDWSYASFAERYGRDIIEKKATVLTLASEAQISELNRLLEAVKMPDGWLEKCLDKAGAATVQEVDAEKMDKLIALVKERVVV